MQNVLEFHAADLSPSGGTSIAATTGHAEFGRSQAERISAGTEAAQKRELSILSPELRNYNLDTGDHDAVDTDA